jgi:hypothetical protein
MVRSTAEKTVAEILLLLARHDGKFMFVIALGRLQAHLLARLLLV